MNYAKRHPCEVLSPCGKSVARPRAGSRLLSGTRAGVSASNAASTKRRRAKFLEGFGCTRAALVELSFLVPQDLRQKSIHLRRADHRSRDSHLANRKRNGGSEL
jgi:hypothetical protein